MRLSVSASILHSSSPWIISKRDDLVFFIGSALLGYALIAAAFANNGLPGTFLVFYAFAIDGPHVFSTLTRSLFDSNERSKLNRLWLIAFPACVVAIALFALAVGADAAFIGVAFLSTYHLAKQHMGFVMIYKRKTGEREDYRIDKYFTLTSLLLPFGLYVSALLGFVIPLGAFLIPAVVIAVLYAHRQIRKDQLNVPKLLLLTAFIPLQWFTWSYAAGDPHSALRLATAGIAINVGHSFQYLRLMYFHNHNRYGERAGLLGAISQRGIYFLAAATILALPTYFSTQIRSFALSAFVVGMLLFHFIVDSRIWRLRGDHELARALNL